MLEPSGDLCSSDLGALKHSPVCLAIIEHASYESSPSLVLAFLVVPKIITVRRCSRPLTTRQATSSTFTCQHDTPILYVLSASRGVPNGSAANRRVYTQGTSGVVGNEDIYWCVLSLCFYYALSRYHGWGENWGAPGVRKYRGR